MMPARAPPLSENPPALLGAAMLGTADAAIGDGVVAIALTSITVYLEKCHTIVVTVPFSASTVPPTSSHVPVFSFCVWTLQLPPRPHDPLLLLNDRVSGHGCENCSPSGPKSTTLDTSVSCTLLAFAAAFTTTVSGYTAACNLTLPLTAPAGTTSSIVSVVLPPPGDDDDDDTAARVPPDAAVTVFSACTSGCTNVPQLSPK